MWCNKFFGSIVLLLIVCLIIEEHVEQVNAEQCNCEDIQKDIRYLLNITSSNTARVRRLEREIEQLQNNVQQINLKPEPKRNDVPLRFHTRCGTNVMVTYNGTRAKRIDTENIADHATVITNRQLKTNELFEVRLDRRGQMRGGLQIGVTLYNAENLNFPADMWYERESTWIMLEDMFAYKGEIVKNHYGPNLINLKEGDFVGIMRNSNYTLHAFVNGVDLGAAVTDVPEHIYGFVDLYGKAIEASIINP